MVAGVGRAAARAPLAMGGCVRCGRTARAAEQLRLYLLVLAALLAVLLPGSCYAFSSCAYFSSDSPLDERLPEACQGIFKTDSAEVESAAACAEWCGGNEYYDWCGALCSNPRPWWCAAPFGVLGAASAGILDVWGVCWKSVVAKSVGPWLPVWFQYAAGALYAVPGLTRAVLAMRETPQQYHELALATQRLCTRQGRWRTRLRMLALVPGTITEPMLDVANTLSYAAHGQWIYATVVAITMCSLCDPFQWRSFKIVFDAFRLGQTTEGLLHHTEREGFIEGTVGAWIAVYASLVIPFDGYYSLTSSTVAMRFLTIVQSVLVTIPCACMARKVLQEQESRSAPLDDEFIAKTKANMSLVETWGLGLFMLHTATWAAIVRWLHEPASASAHLSYPQLCVAIGTASCVVPQLVALSLHEFTWLRGALLAAIPLVVELCIGIFIVHDRATYCMHVVAKIFWGLLARLYMLVAWPLLSHPLLALLGLAGCAVAGVLGWKLKAVMDVPDAEDVDLPAPKLVHDDAKKLHVVCDGM